MDVMAPTMIATMIPSMMNAARRRQKPANSRADAFILVSMAASYVELAYIIQH
jgi:hypothetical protein